jgi:hypothetical protein
MTRASFVREDHAEIVSPTLRDAKDAAPGTLPPEYSRVLLN